MELKRLNDGEPVIQRGESPGSSAEGDKVFGRNRDEIRNALVDASRGSGYRYRGGRDRSYDSSEE